MSDYDFTEPTPGGPGVFAETEYKTRIKRLQNHLKEAGIHAALIFNRSDLFYYSGSGIDGVMLVTIDDVILRFVQRGFDVFEEDTWMPSEFMIPMPSFRVLKEKLPQILTEEQIVGIEEDILPVKTYKYLQKALNVEFRDISSTTREIRSVKSQAEINLMKTSSKYLDESFEFIESRLKEGMREVDVSAMLEQFFRTNNHPGNLQIRAFQHNQSTSALVSSGPNIAISNSLFSPFTGNGITALHRTGPTKRKIRANEPVLIDSTMNYEGYISDETVTFVIGSLPKEMQEAMVFLEEFHEYVNSHLRNGVVLKEFYEELVSLVKEKGYYDWFMGYKEDKVKFIAHGVGLELDDWPLIAKGFPGQASTNNIFATEPKLIFSKRLGGVGIERTKLVGSSRSEDLTRFTHSI